jgi:hypothetical protein
VAVVAGMVRRSNPMTSLAAVPNTVAVTTNVQAFVAPPPVPVVVYARGAVPPLVPLQPLAGMEEPVGALGFTVKLSPFNRSPTAVIVHVRVSPGIAAPEPLGPVQLLMGTDCALAR